MSRNATLSHRLHPKSIPHKKSNSTPPHIHYDPSTTTVVDGFLEISSNGLKTYFMLACWCTHVIHSSSNRHSFVVVVVRHISHRASSGLLVGYTESSHSTSFHHALAAMLQLDRQLKKRANTRVQDGALGWTKCAASDLIEQNISIPRWCRVVCLILGYLSTHGRDILRGDKLRERNGTDTRLGQI